MKIYIKDIRDCHAQIPDGVFSDKIAKCQGKIELQSYAVWSTLYSILKNEYQIKNFELSYNEYQKPYIKDIYFNISHSHNMIAIIISNEECGIDIEYLNPNKDITQLKNRFNIENDEEFYKQWTRKEAYLKKIGTGIKISSLFEEVNGITSLKVQDNDGNYYYVSYC